MAYVSTCVLQCSSTHYSDNTVLVSSKETSAPRMIKNLENLHHDYE